GSAVAGPLAETTQIRDGVADACLPAKFIAEHEVRIERMGVGLFVDDETIIARSYPTSTSEPGVCGLSPRYERATLNTCSGIGE
ncbi:MAG TPA: hypothetical protein VF040_16110, partial [Ktedonobacterales bacterium]